MKIRELPIGSPFDPEEIELVATMLERGDSLSFGPCRQQFEDVFAAANGTEFAVSCNSGTVALWLAMKVAGIRPGDRVIASPQTYQATIFPALEMGATVDFADILPGTLNMDPASLAERIDRDVKAVIATHYGGNPCDMDRLRSVCDQAGALLIADAAHAPGVRYKGTPVGALADISCFSFQSLKNMNTLGEGGMVVFRSRKRRNMARDIANNGVHGEFIERPEAAIGPYRMAEPPLADHSLDSYRKDCAQQPMLGMNFRMSELQSAIGLTQLKKLDGMNRERRRVADLYDRYLGRIKGLSLWERNPDECCHHLYPVFIDNDDQARHDRIINTLFHEDGIEIVQRYFPLHLLHVMRRTGTGPGLCPVCERTWFFRQVNLPIHPTMTGEQVAYVAESLEKALTHG